MNKEIDLTRLSQNALKIARKYDIDGNGSLDSKEYEKFMSVWNKENSGKSPLLMQLHISSLNDFAKKIAEKCDNDDLKGVLTGNELNDFMIAYEKSGLKSAFKPGVDIYAILQGETKENLVVNTDKKNKNVFSFGLLMSGKKLFENLVKRFAMNYKGCDKYFHAVGNFEAVKEGNEKNTKFLCGIQDLIKKIRYDRLEEDFAEDLYANFLGQEFAKLYPNENPYELFEGLAPAGFSIEKAQKDYVDLVKEENAINNYLEKKLLNKLPSWMK